VSLQEKNVQRSKWNAMRWLGGNETLKPSKGQSNGRNNYVHIKAFASSLSGK